MSGPSLKKSLDTLYRGFDFAGRAAKDPISIPMRYSNARDIEVAGFIASAHAYGKVTQFLPVLERIMDAMNNRPYEFIMGFNTKEHARLFDGMGYRFSKPADLAGLIIALRHTLKKHGSLENLFLSHSDTGDADMGAGLAGMMAELKSGAFRRGVKPRGFSHYFPSPSTGGAAKRGALFMRWMVRKHDPDFGIWKRVSPAKLVIPLDTHIARISRCLGLTSRKSDGWATAIEITEALRKLDASDPIKYDFALCHRGISGLCAPSECDTCELGKIRKP